MTKYTSAFELYSYTVETPYSEHRRIRGMTSFQRGGVICFVFNKEGSSLGSIVYKCSHWYMEVSWFGSS